MDWVVVFIVLLIIAIAGLAIFYFRSQHLQRQKLAEHEALENLEYAAALYTDAHKIDRFDFEFKARVEYEALKAKKAEELSLQPITPEDKNDASNDSPSDESSKDSATADAPQASSSSSAQNDKAAGGAGKPRVFRSLASTTHYPEDVYHDLSIQKKLVDRAQVFWRQVRAIQEISASIKEDNDNAAVPRLVAMKLNGAFKQLEAEEADIFCEAEKCKPGTGWGQEGPYSIIAMARRIEIELPQMKAMKLRQEEEVKRKKDDEEKAKKAEEVRKEVESQRQAKLAEKTFQQLMKQEDNTQQQRTTASKKKSKKAD